MCAHTPQVTGSNEAPDLKTSLIALDFPSRLIIELNTFRKVDFPTRAFPTAAITRIGRSICDISFKTSRFSSNAFGELLLFTECSRILACCASVTITKPESERSVPKAISSKQIMVHSLLGLIHNFDTLNYLFGETTREKQPFEIHEIHFRPRTKDNFNFTNAIWHWIFLISKAHFQPWCNAVVYSCFESSLPWIILATLSQNSFCVFSDEFGELVKIILSKTTLYVLIRYGIRWIHWF